MFISIATSDNIRRWASTFALLGGVVLLVALSWEIIGGSRYPFSKYYMTIQLVVCVLFLVDFFVRCGASECRARFLVSNLLFLFLCIPYLNIIEWGGVYLSHDWSLLFGIMPLARVVLAFYVLTHWFIASGIGRLLIAYMLTVVFFTYISSLVFFYYESPVNATLHGFGNAFWWAWMNVTTVGAQIFPITAIGKFTAVMLPMLGMMMFPIFTVYIVQRFTVQAKNAKKKSE